ncbi:universal stress protein [Hoyosella altamirensis]|uniref:Nucleotide-binding universal stress UspA family protein n=1 Tax=Hoyosella altamirensis TaxID=616997 RepID=A0A839RGR9_9ACTN|nr:universal stress protein [Hoyosella altamirensis]MBB3035577.1 nucleotide-binding universal stress UspA family protein [Hoyosella altamirensis]
MSLTQPIIVGTDGSPAAESAVRWAAREAVLHDAPLRIVSALDGPPQVWGDFAIPTTYLEEARQFAASRLKESARIAAEAGIENAETAVLSGFAHEDLIAESRNARMLVLGSRGLSPFKASMVGSVTHAVASHVTAPLVVIQELQPGWDTAPSAPVVVGVDGSEHNLAAIDIAFAEASVRGAQLIAVHAWSDVVLPKALRSDQGLPWENMVTAEEARLAESLAGWGEKYPEVEVRRVVIQDRPVRYLSELSAAASLVVVGNRGRGGFTGMLLGSTSRALLHTCQSPLMTVPPQS